MTSDDVVRDMNSDERAKIVQVALGRIFLLGSRATQPGDVAEYERCRVLIMAASEPQMDTRPNYARDRRKGSGV